MDAVGWTTAELVSNGMFRCGGLGTSFYWKTRRGPGNALIACTQRNLQRKLVCSIKYMYGAYATPQEVVQQLRSKSGNDTIPDVHLAEVLHAACTHYQFFLVTQPGAALDITAINTVIIEGFQEAFDLLLETSQLKWSASTFKGRVVHYLVIDSGHVFSNMQDIYYFVRVYLDDLLESDAVDTSVYSAGSVAKLPVVFQSVVDNLAACTARIPLNESDNAVSHFVTCKQQPFAFHDTRALRQLVKQRGLPSSYSCDVQFRGVPPVAREHLECLPALLSIIPNSGQHQQTRDAYLMLLYVCRNEGCPYSEFSQWSRRSGKHIEENCKLYWTSTNVCKGYTLANVWKALNVSSDVLASLYVWQVMSPTFSHPLLARDLVTNGQYFPSLGPYLSNHNVLVLQGMMACGKTHSLVNFLRSVPDKTVVVVTPRRQFALEVYRILKDDCGLQVSLYLPMADDVDYRDINDTHSLVIQLESLYKLKRKFDIVVIDEIESVLAQLYSPTDKELGRVATILQELLVSAERVILADAFVADRTLVVATGIGKPVMHVSFQPQQRVRRTAVLLRSHEDLVDKVLLLHEEGKRVVVATSVLVVGVTLKNRLGDACLWVEGDTDDAVKNRAQNINDWWSEYPVVVYSPTMTVGNSYTLRDRHHVCVASSSASCPVRDVMQMLHRCRYPSEPTVYVSTSTRGYPNGTSDRLARTSLLVSFKEVAKASCVDFHVVPWLKDVWVLTRQEQNVSSRLHRNMLMAYLRKCGYVVELNDGQDRQPAKLDPVPAIDYYAVPLLQPAQVFDVQRRVMNSIATTMDKWQLAKHHFENCILNEGTEVATPEIRTQAFNKFYKQPEVLLLSANLLRANLNIFEYNRHDEVQNSFYLKVTWLARICTYLGLQNLVDFQTEVSWRTLQTTYTHLENVWDHLSADFGEKKPTARKEGQKEHSWLVKSVLNPVLKNCFVKLTGRGCARYYSLTSVSPMHQALVNNVLREKSRLGMG